MSEMSQPLGVDFSVVDAAQDMFLPAMGYFATSTVIAEVLGSAVVFMCFPPPI
ncbi:MAG: hypothetical protein GY696_01940 [Gammaproteobacteria bacterium]|nr:hypothetical protein [Gammaproteobacteria bacterium]